MRPDISVIMPVHNAAPWIGRAIESVRLQKKLAWELLIIDDNSTDATPDIAGRYAARDGRVRFLCNAHAKGVGGARNTGLEAATGVLISFLDGDDLLPPGALAALRDTIASTRAEVVQGSMLSFCQLRWLAAGPFAPSYPGNGRVGLPQGTFWQYCFRADFLERHGIRFAEDLVVGQDSFFLCHACSLIKRLPLVRRPVYIYRVNHKPALSSRAKAEAYLSLALRVRAMFERAGRAEWFVPYMEAGFLAGWLGHAHTMLQMGKSHALAYMERVAQLLHGLEDTLTHAFVCNLGPAAAPFSLALRRKDPSAMLEALEAHCLLAPADVYFGLGRPSGEKSEGIGPWYKASRRASSQCSSKQSRRVLRYDALLAARSRLFLGGRP